MIKKMIDKATAGPGPKRRIFSDRDSIVPNR